VYFTASALAVRRSSSRHKALSNLPWQDALQRSPGPTELARQVVNLKFVGSNEPISTHPDIKRSYRTCIDGKNPVAIRLEEPEDYGLIAPN
jgi:hypothetical protein